MKIFLSTLFLFLVSIGAYSQGSNWQSLNGPYGGDIRDIAVHPNGNIFASVGENGIFRSTDGGATWTPTVELPNLEITINDLEIDGAGKIYALGDSYLYASSDLGQSWSVLNNGTQFYQAYAIRKTGTTLYVNATNGSNSVPAIYKSTNDGTTFSPVYNSPSSSNYIYEIVVHTSGTILIKVDGIGIVLGTSSGTVWNTSNTGIVNATATNNYTAGQALIMDAAGNLYVLFASGIYKSTNASAGASWAALTNPAGETGYIAGVLASTGTTLFLYVSGHNYYTPTSAIAWTKTGDLFAERRLLPMTATSLLAGTQAGLIASTNSGTNWAASDYGITGRTFYDMVYDNTTFVVAGNFNYPMTTSGNQGVSWTKSSSPEMQSINNYDLLYLPNGNIFSFNDGCDKSINGGTSWTNVPTPVPFTEGDSYDGTTIFARSGNTIYKSTNYGVNWGSALAITGLPASYSIFNLAVSNTSIFLFIRNTNSTPVSELWKISQSTLAATKVTGITFTNTPYGKQIWARGGKIYFFSRNASYQLSVSSNEGTSWTTQNVPSASRFIVTNNGYLVLCAASGSLNFSRDDGSSWVDLTLGYPASLLGITLRQAIVDANGYLYVLLDNKGVLKSVRPVVLPNPPTNMSIVGFGHDRISLEWDDNADNEHHYIIERSVGDNAHYDSASYGASSDQGVTKMAALQTLLTPNTTYFFRVKGINNAGESAYSNEVSTKTLVACAPAIPDNRSWTGVTQNVSGKGVFTNTQIGIRYVGNGGYSISDFTAGIYTTVFGAATMVGTFTEDCGNTHLHTGVITGSTSRIISNNNGTYVPATKTLTLKWQTSPVYYFTAGSQFAETIVLTLNPNASDPAPGAPTNVNALVYDDTGMEVQWAAGYFQNQYTVERSTSPTFATAVSVVGTVNAPTLTVVDRTITFVNNSTYYYRVKALNINGVASPYSSIASAVYKKPYFVPVPTVTGVADVGVGRISAAFIDFNHDDLEDLFMAPSGNLETNFIMRNNGNGTFSRTATNLPTGGFINSSWADFNNDGNIDIGGSRQDNNAGQSNFEIYAGNGDGTFTPVNNLPQYNYYFTGTITWMDVNNDKKLDLLVSPHRAIDTQQGIYSAELRVLRNDGTNFSDQSIINLGSGSGGIFINDSKPIDYDNDGDEDILITGFDSGGSGRNSVMLKNDGTGNFSPVNIPAFNINGTFDAYSSSFGDIDNDGDLDVFIGYVGTSNGLFRNNGNGTFTYLNTNAVSEATVSNTYGGTFGDIDNDGDLDLFVFNTSTSIADLQFVYINDGVGNYTRITGEFATNHFRNNQSAAFGDYDKDGFLDLATGFPDKNNTILKNNKKIVTSGNWIEVKLKGTTSNKSAIGARVAVTAGGKTQTRIIQSNSGGAYNGENSLIAHVGLGNTSTITNVKVTWPTGIVQTMIGPAINQILTISEDNLGPAISVLSPANAANGVAIDANLEVTLDDASLAAGASQPLASINAVAGKFIYVYKSSDLVNFVYKLNVNTLTTAGNKFILDLPSDLLFLTQYSVAIDAGAFSDVYGNLSLALSVANWSFTTADNVMPAISFTPIATLDKGFSSPTLFSITATDNSGTISSATMHHRKVSGTTFAELAGAPGGASDQWDFSVADNLFDGMGLEYYFTVKDPSNNEAREPADPDTHVTYIKYVGNTSKIPTLGFGGQKANWKIFSVPFDLGSSNSVTAVFDEIIDLDLEYKTKWRLLTYKNDEAWDEYPNVSTIARGKGYFINILSPIDIIAGDNLQAPPNTQSNLFHLILKKGWNQIGNPYMTPIQWSDAVTLNGLTGNVSSLHVFSGGSYPVGNQLQPFEGGFVLSDADADVDVKVPFLGQTTGGKITEIIDTDLGHPEWKTRLTLQQQDMLSDLGGVGMHPEAKVTRDAFDDFTPPRFFDYLEINFPHPEHFVKQFARDIVPTQPEYTWEFTVDSNLDGLAELSWDNTGFGSNAKDLMLFDIAEQQFVDMRSQDRYSFDPSASGKFRIYFGEDLARKIKPDYLLLGKAYPNPTGGFTTIPFNLPEGNTRYQVRLEVYDMMGQKVATLVEAELNSGFYSTEWNTSVSNLGDGVYIYRMVVANQKNGVQRGKITLQK